MAPLVVGTFSSEIRQSLQPDRLMEGLRSAQLLWLLSRFGLMVPGKSDETLDLQNPFSDLIR